MGGCSAIRAQLRYLMASGSLTVGDVAAVAGISARLADRLLHGRDGRPVRRISPDTARRLIQISDQQVQALRRIMVPAAPARLQLRRLYRAGWRISRSRSEYASQFLSWSNSAPVPIPVRCCSRFG